MVFLLIIIPVRLHRWRQQECMYVCMYVCSSERQHRHSDRIETDLPLGVTHCNSSVQGGCV